MYQKVLVYRPVNASIQLNNSMPSCIGYLGELTLIIPWSNLRNEPVKVIIDHVYLLAEPKNESTVSDAVHAGHVHAVYSVFN